MGFARTAPPPSLLRDAGRGKEEEGERDGEGGRPGPRSHSAVARGSHPPASLLQLGEGIKGPGSGRGGGQEPTLGSVAPLPSTAFHQDTVRGLQWPRAKASGRNPGCLCVGHTGLHRSRRSPEFAPAPATSRAQVHAQSHSRPSDSWGRAGGARILQVGREGRGARLPSLPAVHGAPGLSPAPRAESAQPERAGAC